MEPDKGYVLVEGAELKKVVEMFDPFGKPVSDPSLASRTVTTYYDQEGRLVKRVLGKSLIMRPGGQNDLPDDEPAPVHQNNKG